MIFDKPDEPIRERLKRLRIHFTNPYVSQIGEDARTEAFVVCNAANLRLEQLELLVTQVLVEIEHMDPYDCEHELNELKTILEMAQTENKSNAEPS